MITGINNENRLIFINIAVIEVIMNLIPCYIIIESVNEEIKYILGLLNG